MLPEVVVLGRGRSGFVVLSAMPGWEGDCRQALKARVTAAAPSASRGKGIRVAKLRPMPRDNMCSSEVEVRKWVCCSVPSEFPPSCAGVGLLDRLRSSGMESWSESRGSEVVVLRWSWSGGARSGVLSEFPPSEVVVPGSCVGPRGGMSGLLDGLRWSGLVFTWPACG